MEDSDRKIFTELFREACTKCFGHELATSLSEAESKQLSTTIFEATGLVIGVKSVKNYSQFVTGTGRDENPSTATLDTLARYVMAAPSIDETIRKDREPHHPYWFEYKRKFRTKSPAPKPKNIIRIGMAVLFLATVTFIIYYFSSRGSESNFIDDFNSIDDTSLLNNGWTIISKNNLWWEKRSEKEGHLTLFTLTGDNWSDSSHDARISNLMIREIDAECFSTEVHFSRFVPDHNWQQAGLLLLEDTLLTSRGIRLSLGYNNFFGGYDQAPEILIQAISSLEAGGFRKPEEFIHIPIVKIDTTQRALIQNNLSKSALRIEKQGSTFRFLYSTGPLENSAFKEAAVREFKLSPKYIGIFAIQGFVDGEVSPVYLDKFVSVETECN